MHPIYIKAIAEKHSLDHDMLTLYFNWYCPSTTTSLCSIEKDKYAKGDFNLVRADNKHLCYHNVKSKTIIDYLVPRQFQYLQLRFHTSKYRIWL